MQARLDEAMKLQLEDDPATDSLEPDILEVLHSLGDGDPAFVNADQLAAGVEFEVDTNKRVRLYHELVGPTAEPLCADGSEDCLAPSRLARVGTRFQQDPKLPIPIGSDGRYVLFLQIRDAQGRVITAGEAEFLVHEYFKKLVVLRERERTRE